MKLDLSHLKKIRSDDHVSVLQHDKGHTVTVAHAGLSKAMLKKLQAMPMCNGGEVAYMNGGGYAGDTDRIAEAKKAEAQKRNAAPEAQKSSGPSRRKPALSYDDALWNVTHKGEPGFVPRVPKDYNQGGQVQPSKPPIDEKKAKEVQDSFRKALGFANGGVAHYYEGTPNQTVSQADVDPMAGIFPPSANYPQMSVQPPAPPNMGYQAPTTENPVIPQAASQQAASMIPQGSMIDAGAAVQGMEAGLQKEAAAQGQLGQQQAAIRQENINKLQELQTHYEQNVKKYTQEFDAALNEYRQGKIDPKHWWDSKSDLGKVGTAIGMLLGGLGGADAAGTIDKFIENDINAQKANMDKQKNVLSFMHQQFGNMNDAIKMTKAFKADEIAERIQQAADKMQDPIAKARAQQAASKLRLENAGTIMDVARRQAIIQNMQKGNINPAMAVTALVPKEAQKEVFDELETAQLASKNQPKIMQLFDQADKTNTALRTGAGVLRTAPAANAILTELFPFIKKASGRVTEVEMDQAKKAYIPQPGDSQSTIEQKRANLEHFLEASRAAPRAEGYGIKLPKPASGFKPLK